MSDSAAGAADRITDFQRGVDVIDVSGIDANASSDGDQAFAIVQAFGGQAGQATLSYDPGANTTSFRGDIDGDGLADFELLISGEVSRGDGWVL